jgi:hypothetical protein
MDATRWIVTLAGAALIVVVNVYFFARPRRPSGRPGHGAAGAAGPAGR